MGISGKHLAEFKNGNEKKKNKNDNEDKFGGGSQETLSKSVTFWLRPKEW